MAYPGAGQPQGYPGQPPPQGYPGQGPAPGQGGNVYGYQSFQNAPPPPIPSPEERFIQHAGGPMGSIDSEQLQQIMNEAGFNSVYKTAFSLETCRIMLAMLDMDRNGTMGLEEFRILLSALWAWKQTFDRYDANRSGMMEPHELSTVIQSFGYNLSARAMQILTQRYSRRVHGSPQVHFDDFVACCVRLRGYSDSFRQRDRQGTGWAQMHYDDFLTVVMAL